ncbi:hypothetical protein [Hymenobacter defluvii]|uniref:Uncharacterized protein n=1 Tax=Hymenobacter defluvii TaxID=2054411 RepID=A0ABS3THS0_9BACT|nr:hypothetical protein [Hymenobacter defluvii]MBO3273216.1 hypothetical protein [Hymenobacter defluvii]
MPTVRFPVEGTDAEKLTALCALAIQQQGHINLLTVLVTDLYARANGCAAEIAGPLVDELLPRHITQAADDFRCYVLGHQINQVQDEQDA